MEKNLIRSYISKIKKQMTVQEVEKLSDQLSDAFLNLPAYKNARTLFAYNSFNQEVLTERIIEQALSDGKKVALPRVEGKDIEFRYIDSIESCTAGTFGIMEPDTSHSKAPSDEKKVLMLIPGLAFDAKGTRVGYGKGHYDRYLSQMGPDCFLRIALCYDFQLLDHIEQDRFDIPVHKIICAPSGRIVEVMKGNL